jgi:hypothetical protein
MSPDQLQHLLDSMDPQEALAALAAAAKKLLPLLGEEARLNFMVHLVGAAGGDKVGSLVHL